MSRPGKPARARGCAQQLQPLWDNFAGRTLFATRRATPAKPGLPSLSFGTAESRAPPQLNRE